MIFRLISLTGREVRTGTEKRTDSKGMTLVEMVVTFAVAAIFMAAAAALILPATRMTMHIKGMSRVHDDAAIIMETIVSELSYAEGSMDDAGSIPAITLDDKCTTDGDDYAGYYRKVSYTDKGGNSAVMKTGDESDGDEYKDRLLILYSEIKLEAEGGTETVIRPSVKWGYGKGLYQSNQIRLGFLKKNDDKNIITVRLTVTDPVSGYSYTEETDIRCMNVDHTRIIKK